MYDATTPPIEIATLVESPSASAAMPQLKLVSDIHDAVVHTVRPVRTETEKAAVPKLVPCRVMLPPALSGALTGAMKEATGASKEKEETAEPTSSATVASIDAPTPLPERHERDVPEFQLAVLQTSSAKLAVRLASYSAKLVPSIEIVLDAAVLGLLLAPVECDSTGALNVNAPSIVPGCVMRAARG